MFELLRDLEEFCRRYARIFVVGNNCGVIAKYLRIIGIQAASAGGGRMRRERIKRFFGIGRNAGWIYSEGFAPMRSLPKGGKENSFMISDKLVLQITGKVSHKKRICLEYNVADHCNMNCRRCDHFSPIAKHRFGDFEQFEKDTKQLAKLTNGGRGMQLTLLGGEPTMNPDLEKFIRAAHENLPDADELIVFSNGILLTQESRKENEAIWQAMKDADVKLFITKYPTLVINYDHIRQKADEYGIRCEIFTILKKPDAPEHLSTLNPLDLHGGGAERNFVLCGHFNNCPVLIDGKIFPCPPRCYVGHFNKFFKQNLPENDHKDWLDIYKVSSLEEIAEWLSRPIPFCRFCALKRRRAGKFGVSAKDIKEWT